MNRKAWKLWETNSSPDEISRIRLVTNYWNTRLYEAN